MLLTGIVMYLVLGATLAPSTFSSSTTFSIPLATLSEDSKSVVVSNDTFKLMSLKKSTDSFPSAMHPEKIDMWTKLERYSLMRREALRKENEKLFKGDLSKLRKKDNFNVSKTSYSIVNDEKSPLKTTNLANVSLVNDNVGALRVWQSKNYAYPDSGVIETKTYRNNLSLSSNLKLEKGKHIDRESTGKSPYDMIARFRREVPEDPELVPEYCKPFIEGQPDQQSFFSPGYPGNYPNNSDCIKVLSARQGQLIRLDFRNYFEIESSQECRYDYLEVRDGAHGYSPLIEQGRFCGTEFPPILTSQGRHLWLRFQSDDNIEYRGFVAIYEFITKPTPPYYQPEMDECHFDVNGTEGFINKSDISQERIDHAVKYGIPLDCMWVISVDKEWKIQLTFNYFTLQKPNECESNFLDVFTRTDTPHRLKSYCGSIADPVESLNNILHIRFMVEPRAINSTFAATFTAYREKAKDSNCGDDEYDCEDNTCIDINLRCNGRNNCRYKWDEDECHTAKGSPLMQSDHIIIILAVFSLILFGMSIAFVFNCVKKLINDHRIIQEHIRQSREGNLDSAGCLQTKLAEPISKISIKHDGVVPKSRSGSRELDNVDCYVPGVGQIVPIPLQNKHERNGNVSMPQIHKDHDGESESDDQGNQDPTGSGVVPEMCDSCCQTRESLFQTHPFHHQSSSDKSFSPAPPSVDYSRKPTKDSADSRPYMQQSNTPFSTFGYSNTSAEDPKFKTETVIEMDHYLEDNGNYGDLNRNASHQNRSNDTFMLEDQMNRNRIRLEDKTKKSPGKHSKLIDRHNHFDRRPYSADTTKSAPDVIYMTH